MASDVVRSTRGIVCTPLTVERARALLRNRASRPMNFVGLRAFGIDIEALA